jgi:hypothetical protein
MQQGVVAMNSNASQSPEAVRPFARITACEVTPSGEDQHEEGLFLTIYTDPDRPEPEIGALS